MKRGRPRAKGNIPAWFNVDNYDYAAKLSYSEWADVVQALILLRSFGDDEFKSIHANLLESAKPEEREGLLSVPWYDFVLANYLTVHPVDWPSRRDAAGNIVPLEEEYAPRPEAFNFGPVQSITNRTLAAMTQSFLEFAQARKLVKLVQEMRDAWKNGQPTPVMHRRLREFAERPFFLTVKESWMRGRYRHGIPERRALFVDMRFPDEMIVESFRHWLSAMRTIDPHTAAPKRFKDAEIERWHTDRYIPLLVLERWADLAKIKPTQSELVAALFPDDPTVEPYSLARTIQKNARKWASWETFYALVGMAALESGAIVEDASGGPSDEVI